MTEDFKIGESVKWKGIKKGNEKSKITMMERYGVDSYFKTNESKEYNRQWMSSDEFKEKVKPPLERVFKKRGIGMTDEQLLLYYFGTDFVAKGAQAFMLRKTANGIVDSLRENTLAIREQNAYRTAPNPQQPVQEPERKTENNNSEYTEKISEVLSENEVAPERKRPATNLDEQIEFFEPEETNGVYSILNDNNDGGFKSVSKMANNMPTFGDPDILEGIDKIERESQSGKPSRRKSATKRQTTKRATTKRATVERKPRKQ
jgi:hypothetical protein